MSPKAGAVMGVAWRDSLAVRYTFISIIAAILPLLVVGILYDRHAQNLIASISDERLQRRLTAISGRMRSFLDARWYSLETLASYPALSTMLKHGQLSSQQDHLKAVVELEADQPNLYGILFYTPDTKLVRSVPGQAASGPPYWGGGQLATDTIPSARTRNGVVIGPIPPRHGQAGSLLMLRELVDTKHGVSRLGQVALHVRLASLTELIGHEDETGLVVPVLITPDGTAYSSIGLPVPLPDKLIRGEPILPGWVPALGVKWDELVTPLGRARMALIGVVIFLVVALPWLFVSLSRHALKRISQLLYGVAEVSSGNLGLRIPVAGGDEVARLSSAFNMMTDRLQNLIRATVEMEKMAVLGRFATGVAHEVRNPLAAMKTSAQVLVTGELDAERKEILTAFCNEIDRLDGTVSDLLKFARPHEPKIEELVVGDVFQRAMAMVATDAKEGGIALDVPETCALHVRCDPSQLQQILMNLLLNGVQAMPDGGTLVMRARYEGGRTVMEVCDTGVGINPEIISNITDPFFTTRPDGTGLGLAITRQLVELNHGELGFKSRLGSGTRVLVRLPGRTEVTR